MLEEGGSVGGSGVGVMGGEIAGINYIRMIKFEKRI
jgi:hypothetical protein